MQKRVAVNQINRSRLEANIKRWKEQGRMYHVGQKRWRRTDSAIAVCQSNYIFLPKDISSSKVFRTYTS
jgi:hypothetical protein